MYSPLSHWWVLYVPWMEYLGKDNEEEDKDIVLMQLPSQNFFGQCVLYV